MAIIRMSTSGSRDRSSSRTQAAISSAPPTNRAIVFGDPHPQVLVSVIARSSPEIPAVATLIELRDTGELTQQTLCGRLHIDPTNLVEILNELEQRGYAMRRRDPEDRRRHLVEISDAGVAALDEIAKVMDAVEDELLAGVDPAERERLEGVLTSIWESSGDYAAWAKVAAEA
jgi:DNA-binding MarR family transcriptional regulator